MGIKLEGLENEIHEFETIGKVTLDLTKYPGEDLYSDGAVEEELLRIARDLSPIEYGRVIDESASWPILYHFSAQRENIVEWIPLSKTDKVLDVGSGCGAIAGALAKKAGSVTCVDLSRMRSKINAYRHSDAENLSIKVGNFKDIEPELDRDFDLICLIGVFEYGISYMGGDTPFEDFLKILKSHVKPGGRIVIAIENKLGLKYFAGCREDHMGTYFSGITNYVDGGHARTFSRKGLEKIFENAGVEEYHFYYPYPDYKFMTTLFSDKRLPAKGELSNNLRNFDRDRVLLFDEKNAFDGISKDGLFPVFSNSFLVVIGPDYPTEYVRYSNDRAPQFQICTEIMERRSQTDAEGEKAEGEKAESKKAEGKEVAGKKAAGAGEEAAGACERYVRKRPLSEEAADHVSAMVGACEKLTERFADGELVVNPCKASQANGLPCAEFQFEKGVTLASLLDEALDRGDEEEFKRLFKDYLRRIDHRSDMPVTDFDLVFSNILVENDTWTLIDYEWTFGKAMETRELAFRAIYCYLLEDEKRERLPLDWVLDELGIKPEEADAFRADEQEFQKYVEGQKLSMAKLREKIGKKIIKPWKLIENYQDAEQICRVQVYEDRGNGYSEEASYFVEDAYVTDKQVELTLTVSGDVKTLRIDPIMDSCVVKLQELTFNGERIPVEKKKVLLLNGRSSGGEKPSIVFATADPNLGIDVSALSPKAQNVLYASMEVTRIPLQMAEDLCAALAKHIRL
ncbi:MAG: class I SAM-dependent methyltransferase [Lachnospiraceae bacterium]|nr:class I SAM-dependent methyltransferase [Lachnospiraceae bacterium]